MKTLLCCLGVALAVASASASTVTNLTLRSEKMQKDVPVSVVLPDAYDGSTASN